MSRRLIDLTVAEFADELGSKSPAPGGGSASGVAAVLGASLVSMVANLTVGKKKYADVQDDMKALGAEAADLQKESLRLIDADTEAFNEVMGAFGMPKNSDEEKRARKAAIAEATKGATKVPLQLARLCVKVMGLAVVAAGKGNKNALSDAGVAAGMAEAAYKGAVYNVRINLPGINDEHFKSQVKNELEELDRRVQESASIVYQLMENL